MEINLQRNFINIRQLISQYELKYGRFAGSVQLLAASKGQPIEKLQQAIISGQRSFGESYLQEALTKIEKLNNKELEWHFIGPIQSNKTKKISEHFSWVHSLTNEKIARRLNEQRPLHLPPLNVCIEVNISGEISKSGVHLNEVENLVNFCAQLEHLKIRGLMTIPAPSENINVQRRPFHELANLFYQLQKAHPDMDTLSMGMSEDFEAAIAEGSTIVRIGTALFGERTRP